DLLHVDREHGDAPGELLVGVVAREGQLDVPALARARADQALLEPRDQVPAAELDELVAALAAGERPQLVLARLGVALLARPGLVLNRQRPDVVDHDEVALLRRAV